MNYNKKLSDEIFKMYYAEKIGKNSLCIECRKNAIEKHKELTNGPVPIFHVGKNFENNDKKLLLIGRVAYGWKDELNPLWEKTFQENEKHLYDIQTTVENRSKQLFSEGITKYFEFIKNTLTEIYGNIDTAFDNVALTNYVHCNTGSVSDNIPQIVRNYCSNKDLNGFIHKEIEILKPTHILVLTKDWKYLRYAFDKKWNVKAIKHPSSPGRSKIEFKSDILDFLNN